MGLESLRRARIGNQSVIETGVAADRELVGAMVIRDGNYREIREEFRASMGGSNTVDTLSKGARATYTGLAMTNELPYILAAAITGSPVISVSSWTFNQPLTSAATLTPMTLYTGNNFGQYLRAIGCYAQRVVIRGSNRQALTVDVDWIGHTTEKITATWPVLAHPTDNVTLKNLMTSVFMDTSGATIGDTAVGAGSAYDFTWTWNSGIELDYAMVGSLHPFGLRRGIPSAQLEIVGTWGTTNAVVFSKQLLDEKIFVRLHNTTGAHELILDGAYYATDFNAMDGNLDGVTTARMTLEAIEDTTWGKKIEAVVTGDLTAL